MLFLKRTVKPLLIILITILLLTLFTTILNYFNLFNYSTVNILKIIIPLLAFSIGGYIIGNRSSNNGWLAGLKLSSIFIIILIFFNLIFFKYKIQLQDLIYYAILIGATTFGSMLGINKKN